MMYKVLLFFFLCYSGTLLCDTQITLSPVQTVLAQSTHDDIMPPKEKFVERIADALKVNIAKPTAENKEQIYSIIAKARKCHDQLNTNEDWLKLVANTYEKRNGEAQVALAAHREIHGKFAFDHPFVSRALCVAGGVALGVVGTVAYAVKS